MATPAGIPKPNDHTAVDLSHRLTENCTQLGVISHISPLQIVSAAHSLGTCVSHGNVKLRGSQSAPSEMACQEVSNAQLPRET